MDMYIDHWYSIFFSSASSSQQTNSRACLINKKDLRGCDGHLQCTDAAQAPVVMARKVISECRACSGVLAPCRKVLFKCSTRCAVLAVVCGAHLVPFPQVHAPLVWPLCPDLLQMSRGCC